MITWKGWKEKGHQQITLDECPWGDFGDESPTLEEAKQEAQKKYQEKILSCFYFENT